MTDKYEEYDEHPRYGRHPKVTGLDAVATYKNDVHLRGRSTESCRIPSTAIPANLERQTPASVPVTHYYDEDRQCRDCGKRFIFFAKEQQHWYEDLGFPLDSDCVRCVPCRRKQQGIAEVRERYEVLFHVANKSEDENLEMADCCVSLIEAAIFTPRQTERVRMLLNRIHPDSDSLTKSRCTGLLARVHAIEEQREKNASADEV